MYAQIVRVGVMNAPRVVGTSDQVDQNGIRNGAPNQIGCQSTKGGKMVNDGTIKKLLNAAKEKGHSDKDCCCGGHNCTNVNRNKHHNGTKVRLEHKDGRRKEIRTREEFWAEWGEDPSAEYTDDYDKKMKMQFMEDLDSVIDIAVEDAVELHMEAEERQKHGW